MNTQTMKALLRLFRAMNAVSDKQPKKTTRMPILRARKHIVDLNKPSDIVDLNNLSSIIDLNKR